MKNGASPREDDPSPAPDRRNRFDHFVGIQHDDHLPLKPFEVAKLDDLRDDRVRWRHGEARRTKLFYLGRVFTHDENFSDR